MLNKKFFRRLGNRTREKYRSHVFTKALDVFGNPFPSKYSEPYATLKRTKQLNRQKAGKFNAPKLW